MEETQEIQQHGLVLIDTTTDGELVGYRYLSKRGGVEGLRRWVDVYSPEEVEHFGSRFAVREAFGTYGGVAIMHSSQIPDGGFEADFHVLQPVATRGLV